MILVRALMLSVLALALAIAPAAPCTMGHRASMLDHIAGASAAVPHDHHARARQDGGDPEGHGRTALLEGAQDLPAATAGDDGCPGHRHRSKRTACPSPCCTLGCQAALPAATWMVTPLVHTVSDRVLIAQEDGTVDAHPLRIERPPRLGA